MLDVLTETIFTRIFKTKIKYVLKILTVELTSIMLTRIAFSVAVSCIHEHNIHYYLKLFT